MRASGIALILALALGLAPSACKKHRDSRGASPADGGAAGVGGAAGAHASGAAGDAVSQAGSGGTSGSDGGGGAGEAGSAGAVREPVCGDGLREEPEACDGDDLAGLTCYDQGFEGGELACLECALDTSGCSGTERCSDGRDNDGDLAADCADADCTVVCGDACAAPLELDVPGATSAVMYGHGARYDPSCAAGSGRELIYRFSAPENGVAEATLTSTVGLAASFTSQCGVAASELACAPRRRVEAPVTAGETYFVQVDGYGAADVGEFTLELAVRPVACGDAYRDLEEGCDDGDTQSGDGCSSTCQLEPNELEPNDTPEQAVVVPSPAVGVITADDVDVFQVQVSGATPSLTVAIGDFGEGACAAGELDAMVDILASDGVSVIGTGTPDGPGGCVQAEVGPLEPGTYYVLVRSNPEGTAAVFPYAADIRVNTCGDGDTSRFEECDDGGRTAGDGCAANCTVELDETEPNDGVTEAEALPSPVLARIGSDGDIDVYAVELTGDGSILATTTPLSAQDCTSGPEALLELVADDGSTVLLAGASPAGEPCASVEFWTLPAGTYYLRVSALGIAQVKTFGYTLTFVADECGNGQVRAAEECDDGGNESGDGCTWDCLDE